MDRKFPLPQKTSRTFFFLVSPGMQGVKERFQEFFPVPAELSQLYPWLLMQEEEAFRIEAEESVKQAFAAKRMEEITMRGFSILDSINQVIVIADLCDLDIYYRIAGGCKIIKETIHKIIDPRTPVYWTAIFTLRRPESLETVKDETTEVQSTDSNIVKQISREPFQSLFHRTFLLDISNPLGTLISDPKDQDCLIGHLLYFLTTYPIIAESSDKYADWLVRTAEEGCVSGFSAFSLVLPADQILETVALSKGAEVMKESLFTGSSIHHYSFYLNNFLQKNFLLELGEVKKTVSEDSDFPLKEPVSHLPDFLTMRPEDYLETMNTLDASLPNIAKDNEVIMEKIGEKRLKEWKESLENHLEAMITQETGGLLLARKFLQELLNHLEKLTSDQVAPPQYNDPGPCISVIRRLVQYGPRKEGIYGRALVLAVVMDVGVSSFTLAPWMKVPLLILLPLSILALAAFVSYYNRQEFENQILKLERLLREKWRILIDTGKRKAAKKLLEEFINIVKQLDKEVEAALNRVTELVHYFQTEYIPSFPEEFAFRKFVVRDRDELLHYKDLCKANVSRVAIDYIERDRPLHLWRRLSSHGASQPNEWEQHIMEMAAIRLLPDCGDIVNLHILSSLQAGQEKFERYKMAIVRGIQPFLTIRPGASPPELNGKLETEPKGSHPVVEKLINALSGYFQNIEQIETRAPYRLSFFGFLEGAKIDDIFLR